MAGEIRRTHGGDCSITYSLLALSVGQRKLVSTAATIVFVAGSTQKARVAATHQLRCEWSRGSSSTVVSDKTYFVMKLTTPTHAAVRKEHETPTRNETHTCHAR